SYQAGERWVVEVWAGPVLISTVRCADDNEAAVQRALADAELQCAAPRMYEALRAAVDDPPACFARPDQAAPRTERRSRSQRAVDCECAPCSRQRTFIVALRAADGEG